jgi:integrase
MARPATGNVKIETRADETLRFRLRFRALGERETTYQHESRNCDCGCGGGWNERTAKVELRNILARVQAGVWERHKRATPEAQSSVGKVPRFNDYAFSWLNAKIEGILGEKPLDKNTVGDYRWRLTHLVAFLARYRLDEIDRELCLAFKTHKIREAKELREELAAGADLRDARNRRVIPLGAASIKKLINTLTSILDEAVEDGYLPVNPARSRRLKMHVPKPKRTFLEIDELACIEEAARQQDPSLALYAKAAREASGGSTAAAVASRLADGVRPGEIARDLRLAKSTVSFHVTRLGVGSGKYVGRGAILYTLGRSGVRVSELCDMHIGQMRLHDPKGARFHIPDAKTEKGIREVEITPDLVEVIAMHIDRLRRAGHDTSPEAFVFQNERGGRISRQRVAEIVREAATRASETMRQQGLPPLPNVTPHSLRRAYISIALLVNNFDVLFVMNQVGHADSKMTVDVYAQLQQRAKRDHGASFDRLMRDAHAQRYSATTPAVEGFGTTNGTTTAKTASRQSRKRRPERGQNVRISREKRRMARPRLELGTPRFSVVCSTN